MKGVEEKRQRWEQKKSDLKSINEEIEATERELIELQKPEGETKAHEEAQRLQRGKDRHEKGEEAAAESTEHRKS